MKRYIIFGLAGIVMGWTALPAIALGGNGGKSAGNSGSPGSAAVARPGSAAARGSANMQSPGVVASRQNVANFNALLANRLNAAVSMNPTNAGVATPADSVSSGTGGNGDHRRHRHHNQNNNGQGSIVVVTSGNDGNYPGNNGEPWSYANGMGNQNMPLAYPYGAQGMYDATQPPYSAATPGQPESPDFVVAVQRELRRRGFYRGVIHGNSDACTRAAIRSFEASMGMPVTGVIGMPLMRALGFMQ